MKKVNWKNILVTVAVPLGMWLLMELLCRVNMGRAVIASSLDLKNYIRNVGISACVALALSFNLGTGRFDLSLGAQRIAATVVGGNLALRLGLGSWGVLLCSLAFGLLFGGLVGLIFVTFRVPPMVLGVGMALIYECVAFATSDANGLQLFGKGVDSLSNMGFTIVVVLLATVFVGILYQYTAFGYRMRAITGSQKIAKDSGINIFSHAFWSYTLAGGLVSFSGVFDAAFKGTMSVNLGFASNTTVMQNCFSMFLGKYLAKWSNEAVGIVVATMTLKMLGTGMSVLKLSDNVVQLTNMTLFLLFLIFRANEKVFQQRRQRSARIRQAQEKKALLAAA